MYIEQRRDDDILNDEREGEISDEGYSYQRYSRPPKVCEVTQKMSFIRRHHNKKKNMLHAFLLECSLK